MMLLNIYHLYMCITHLYVFLQQLWSGLYQRWTKQQQVAADVWQEIVIVREHDKELKSKAIRLRK